MTDEDLAPAMPKNRRRLLERLDLMVRSGQVTAEEATANLQQIREGEHPRRLRAHLRTITWDEH